MPNVTCAQYIDFLGERLKSKEVTGVMYGHAVMCKEKNHENEPLQYYCIDCSVCICQKCRQARHNLHKNVGIQRVIEERKTQMVILLDRVKAKFANIEAKMMEQTELMKKSEDQIYTAEKEMTETVQEGIRLLNEHKMAMKAKLDGIRETQQRKHCTKMKNFEMLASQLKSSLEHGKDIVQRRTGPEILEVEPAVRKHCEELLNAEEIRIFKPPHVTYVSRRSVLASQVVASHSDPSQSTTEGKDLRDRGIHEFEFELSSS